MSFFWNVCVLQIRLLLLWLNLILSPEHIILNSLLIASMLIGKLYCLDSKVAFFPPGSLCFLETFFI